MTKPTVLALLAISFFFTGCETTNNNGLAVVRGQKDVAPSMLPLVCFTFGTQNIGMPIHSVTLTSVTTLKSHTFILSKSFGNNHPDYLTAITGNTVLCLITLRLDPGEYLIDSVEYNGNKNDSYEYRFNFSEYKKLRFKVEDKAVNYVGSVEFLAQWMPMLMRPNYNIISRTTSTREFATQIFVKDTAQRDSKWVYDQIPGMRNLPTVFSKIEDR